MDKGQEMEVIFSKEKFEGQHDLSQFPFEFLVSKVIHT